MRKSPRIRRLEADYRGIQQLSAESTIFDYESIGRLPEVYRFFFRGPGTYKTKRNTVALRDTHEIVVDLGAAYPRLIPGITWQTPVFHPNISSSGIVCLGGYGTNWVPSLRLDELCVMLWDMIRYQNYDVESPYNREAALWAREQGDFRFPLDDRSLRNLVAGQADEIVTAEVKTNRTAPPPVVVDTSRKAANDMVVNVVRETRKSNDGITFLD
ncbi:MAG: ubiquitin-conjugating enzyme E2 [Pirellulaceae bacterium]